MQRIVSIGMLVSLILCGPACSKDQLKSVLDDISRDTYEQTIREQRAETFGNPTDEEPPTYDQYQRQREAMIMDQQDGQPAPEMPD